MCWTVKKLFCVFIGQVSPVLAQPRQRHQLWRLHSNMPQWRGELCLPGPGDDSNEHPGNCTQMQHWRRRRRDTDKRKGSGRSEGDVERDGSSNQRASGRMWTHKEVCCHGHQCGLFFFWMPLTNCMQATYWDPVAMTTLAAHTAGVEKQNRGRGETE